MMSSYSGSLAKGTVENRRKQAQEYIRFAVIYRVPYLAPDLTQACMFAQALVNNHAAPTTIKNYISGARSWIQEHGGDNSAFHAPQFTRLLKGFVKNSTHVPEQAPPLLPCHIKDVCYFIDSCPSTSLCVKPAILIAYSCFLRASNVCAPTMNDWLGPHTLLAKDIALQQGTLTITIRSTKTRSKANPIAFEIQEGSDPLVCPLLAWARYQRLVRPSPWAPAFVHADGFPLTSKQLVAIMRLALRHRTDLDPRRVTMHSLRRGATHASVEKGVPLDTIKTRGTWASESGIKPYLPSHTRKVPTVPVTNLAD